MSYDHAALKAVIDAEPANAGLDDAAVLAWLEAEVTSQGDITAADYREWLATSRRAVKLRSVLADAPAYHADSPAVGTPDDDVVNAAWVADAIAKTSDGIELSRPGAGAALAPLVGTVYTVAERDVLLAYGQSQVPRWRDEGLQKPVLGDVVAARAL